MINKLREIGVKSDYAYIGAVASIGLAYLSHYSSRLRKNSDKAQADRWGIFVGTWAPTLFGLGIALRLEELHDDTPAAKS
ncbi:hypothetical protein FOE78_08930 [Microlunatus elymi]|uniref:Uncharacterized protein n=1 Tax=Microlunatus elymi TaxID=2596828 RepID=A0A516PXV5_9ACTN|nr:hypothetical protein [Microlunatus elymi]QDP96005.1 hypothetical protein FOE78_08930 [Microlunatus elymi]